MDFEKGEILLFDKPYTWTSFDLVNKVKHIIRYSTGKKIKVGHAGTLDPLATGLLVVCTGRFTKLIDSIQAGTKAYIAKIKLGSTTPSFDLETEIDAVFPTDHVTIELVNHILPQFLGSIMQIPPAHSAIRINGKRAYEMARKGVEVDLKARELVIDQIEVLKLENNELTLKVVCSKGTYIRSLARDIGIALCSGAHLVGLQRTQIGEYKLENAFSIENFEKSYRPLKQS